MDETLKFVNELKLVEKAQPGMSGLAVYGDLKREMYRETVQYLETGRDEEAREVGIIDKKRKEQRGREENVAAWQKAKL